MNQLWRFFSFGFFIIYQFHHKSKGLLPPPPLSHRLTSHSSSHQPYDASGHRLPVFLTFSPFHMALPLDQQTFHPFAIWPTPVLHKMFLGIQTVICPSGFSYPFLSLGNSMCCVDHTESTFGLLGPILLLKDPFGEMPSLQCLWGCSIHMK